MAAETTDPSSQLSLRVYETPGDGISSIIWPATFALIHLVFGSNHQPVTNEKLLQWPCLDINGKRVLEVGSGCGLLGMVIASMGADRVILTDRAVVEHGLKRQVLRNLPIIDAYRNRRYHQRRNNSHSHSVIEIQTLKWGTDIRQKICDKNTTFDIDIIIVSDCSYWSSQFRNLYCTLLQIASFSLNSALRIIIGHQWRRPNVEITFFHQLQEYFCMKEICTCSLSASQSNGSHIPEFSSINLLASPPCGSLWNESDVVVGTITVFECHLRNVGCGTSNSCESRVAESILRGKQSVSELLWESTRIDTGGASTLDLLDEMISDVNSIRSESIVDGNTAKWILLPLPSL